MGERRCRCAIWVHGNVKGKLVRTSLKTRNWEVGQERLREMEMSGRERAIGISVEDACDRFMDYQRSRNLRASSLAKYDLLVRELKFEFRGPLEAVTLPFLREYQSSWKLCPESRLYKLSRLRTFFRFCVENGWLRENPAKSLARPVFVKKPAVPFSTEEMEKILWATEVYPDSPKGRREKVSAFVLVLRYTGLRIGDVVALRKEHVNNGKLCLQTAKTGTGVWIPLKDELRAALDRLETSAGYFFYSGDGTLKSAISSWSRTMRTLFRLAGVTGHPHQFRHYFSVDLLSKGVPIEDVAALLGHSSSLVTARYYNAYVKVRQDRLEAEIEKAWKIS